MNRRNSTLALMLIMHVSIAAASFERIEQAAAIPVRYVAIHDPLQIYLKMAGDTVIEATYNRDDFERLYAIEPADDTPDAEKPLFHLMWTAEKGVHLVGNLLDREVSLTGSVYPHPIDIAADQLSESARSTPEIAGVYVEAAAAWDAEVGLAYQRLGGDEVETLRASQAAWLAYRESHWAYLHHFRSTQEGTIWSISIAGRMCGFNRGRARELRSLEQP